jgi:Domain of unknown function (DUF5680)
MTNFNENRLASFLVDAKRNTYASQRGKTSSSRIESHDLEYRNDGYFYLDSYFGEKDFSGQEIVYFTDKPIWSMNYYGRMLQDEVPQGFIETLRGALMRVEAERPFRGCNTYSEGKYFYSCTSEGSILSFAGQESIKYDGKEVCQLNFHGGQIR